MDKGVLYIVGDDKYFEETVQSAKSIRRYTSVDIAVVTERDPEDCPEIFDQIIFSDTLGVDFSDKVRNIDKSPFDRTVFLDADTYVTEDISPLFNILDTVDIAASHAPYRSDAEVNVPEPFPEFNTGVVPFADRESVHELFDSWIDYYSTFNYEKDQPAFRKAMYETSVRHHVLTPEWNCRSIYPGYLDGNVKIIHGRHDDLEEVEQKLNSRDQMRVHYRTKRGLKIRGNSAEWLHKRLLESIKERGISQTAVQGMQYLRGKNY